MFLWSAFRVQRTLSIETSFEGITRDFKELSSIVPRISSSVCEKHGNRSFFVNERLLLEVTHIFLWSTCRVQRMLSIETSFEEITRVFKDLSSFILKISCSVL